MREHLSPLQSIRKKCVEDCMMGQAQEVRLCPITECPLYEYRMGHNPARAGVGAKSHSYKKAASTKESEAENANTEVYAVEVEL